MSMEEAPIKPAASRAVNGRKVQARSRVSNNREILPDVDGRSTIARRFRDISSAIAADQGGADRLSETRLQLVRRFAACACLAERLESQLANGVVINITEHSLLCSTLTRLAQRIGIDRRSRNITPTVSDYVDHINKQQTINAQDEAAE